MRIAILLFLPALLAAQSPEITLTQNLVISRSCTVKKERYVLRADSQNYLLPTEAGAVTPVITIEGDGITVDFNNAELVSTATADRPDLFTGLAIRIRGKFVTLKNASVRGFKIALLAENAASLRLENCDFSYNYRPRLHSIRERARHLFLRLKRKM